MSDHNETRYRSNEDVDRELEPAGTHSDPLAELARLIGQNDPFAHMRQQAHLDAPRDDHLPENRYSDWRNELARPRAAYDEPSDAYDRPRTTYDEPRAAYDEPRAYDEPHHAADTLSAPHLENDAALYQDEPTLTAEQPATATEQFYDEPPAPKRVGIATAVIVLVGCVAVGVASAFAYRAYLKLPETSSPPPVIHASSEPTKVVPPPAPKNDTTKLSYDRVGDRSQNEKVVPQEEKPIDPKNLVTATPPPPPVAPPPTTQAVPVAPAAAAPAPTPAPQAAAPASANPPSVLTEPKRVRTVAVRPDQSDTTPPPQLLTPTPPPAAAPARSPATSVFPPPPTAAPSAAPKAAARPQTRAATPAPAPPARAAPSANAPLSLNPSAPTASTNTRSVRAAAPPTQVTSAAPTPAAPKATKVARPGGYMVQVASQRSEADAQASFRSIRTKYSNVIGTGDPVIRRADLGAKGVYYRAMVGPYATRDEAVQVCANLKAAGGSCVVQSH